MEYLPRGTLTDEIRKRGGKLDEPRITRYSRQIARGIDYLHSRGLVHCDIKGRNILIGEDGAKIADFGCAKSADEVGSCCGTPAFMAPEVARGEEQGKPADIWAFGCTVIEMATGRSLWGGDGGDPLSVLYRIGFSDASAEIPGSLSEEAKDFLEKCLRRNPEDRWTTSQLLNHPFLVDPTTCSSPNRASDSSSSSPTSILDLGFWNSVETESEITKSSSQFTQSCEEEVSPSAANRIGQLAGPSGRWPGWAGNDVDWVTVRGNFGGGGDRDGGDNDEKHGNAGSVEVEEVGIGPVGLSVYGPLGNQVQVVKKSPKKQRKVNYTKAGYEAPSIFSFTQPLGGLFDRIHCHCLGRLRRKRAMDSDANLKLSANLLIRPTPQQAD
ncbi:hypothetical protein CRG98_010988 [Punica granatum]|uniref:Protein kinase domain-containing protein n=1 Tax=Punica granatum TaxID=22663 RepID=A0A2I0KJ99_PUNGR|nr:hypothetical protein CRG98_010988 [Punica granatum]